MVVLKKRFITALVNAGTNTQSPSRVSFVSCAKSTANQKSRIAAAMCRHPTGQNTHRHPVGRMATTLKIHTFLRGFQAKTNSKPSTKLFSKSFAVPAIQKDQSLA